MVLDWTQRWTGLQYLLHRQRTASKGPSEPVGLMYPRNIRGLPAVEQDSKIDQKGQLHHVAGIRTSMRYAG